MSFSFSNLDTTNNRTLSAFPRFQDGANYVEVRFSRDKVIVYKRVAGTYTKLGTDYTFTQTQGDVYQARIAASGDDLNVYFAEPGEVETELYDLTDSDLNFTSQKQ